MSIDQPGSNGCPFTQAQICGRFCRQPAAQCRSRIDNGGADAVKIIRAEFGKTDGLEIVGVPAALMTKVGPFAGNRADGPCKAAGRPPCQEIGQVEKCSALPKISGRFSFSQSSFGVSISGEIWLPTYRSTSWPPALIRSAWSRAR